MHWNHKQARTRDNRKSKSRQVACSYNALYEKYADGRERDRASGFNYQPMVFQIRASCSNLGDETESYGEAEIEAIRMALNFI